MADASGVGILEVTQMRKHGYDAGFSCAVTVTSATIGPVFPPSIPMIFYAMLSGASIGALFMGGMLPGILMSIALMVYIAYISNKRKYPMGDPFILGKFLRATFTAIPALAYRVLAQASTAVSSRPPKPAHWPPFMRSSSPFSSIDPWASANSGKSWWTPPRPPASSR